mmetsp:Transcript_47532/g.118871  ORF Transcript_47532/g.118871 Transcript_47532/m.118871 type:complete len:248 (-) Transcript_47532:1917-2660(-)
MSTSPSPSSSSRLDPTSIKDTLTLPDCIALCSPSPLNTHLWLTANLGRGRQCPPSSLSRIARDLPSTAPPTLLASRTIFSACRRVRSWAAPLAPTSKTSPHTTRHSSPPSSSFLVSLARPSTHWIETSSNPTVTCAVPSASPFLGPSRNVMGSSSVAAAPSMRAWRASAREQVALAMAITPSLAYCVPTGSFPSVMITLAPPSVSSFARAACRASRFAFMRPVLTPNDMVCLGLAGLKEVRGNVSLL